MNRPLFNKLLIANRGEIACRVMRTAKDMGIKTVAIYAPADQNALHVQQADEAWALNSDALSESYLDIAQIIEIAQRSAASAVHPGYGFLSENSAFSRACVDAGLVFVGPTADTITSMAQKDVAKQLMQANGVPVIPGFNIDATTDIAAEAAKAGFPLLIKAVGGGGGKGMRLVQDLTELTAQIEQAQQEAESAFGDKRVLCERYLPNARHIEVQVFFDNAGNGVYMFERDCSLQRRYQKVIEFAPADITDGLRQQMGEVAVAAGRAVDYSGAGTVEFLLANDGSGDFFFLEMNTRLQVEHPVTEMVVDEDLVAWQLKVAAGLALPKSQSALQIHCHAMELRLYAENPLNDFAPSSGVINHLILPKNCRIDHGIAQGQAIINRYDPMLGKLIVTGDTYQACLHRAKQALQQCFVGGIHTNIAFLQAVLNTPAVQENDLGVKTLESMDIVPSVESAKALMALMLHLLVQRGDSACWRQWWVEQQGRDGQDDGITQSFFDQQQKILRTVSISKTASQQRSAYLISCDDEPSNTQVRLQHSGTIDENSWVLHWQCDQTKSITHIIKDGAVWHVLLDGNSYQFRLPASTDFAYLAGSDASVDKQILAPMPGIVQTIAVNGGELVATNDTVVVIEAMKVLTHLSVPVPARISDIYVSEGQNVSEGQLLAEWEYLDE